MNILSWLFGCRFGHKWNNKDGGLNRILSADRGLQGEMLMKNPDGGWLRYHRYCKRCGHTQYLKQSHDGLSGSWESMP